MNEIDILKRIVAENGSCCWSRASVCSNCPISKLKIKSDGNYMSCVESLGIQELPEEAADAKYLEVATKMLLAEAIDDLLSGDKSDSK